MYYQLVGRMSMANKFKALFRLSRIKLRPVKSVIKVAALTGAGGAVGGFSGGTPGLRKEAGKEGFIAGAGAGIAGAVASKIIFRRIRGRIIPIRRKK